jgi:three-Cys-motif partner protein
MGNDRFFEEAKEQSVVKSTIVSKYFWAWAKVIMPTVKRQAGRIAYIDLFAGPGRYKDGTKSTPLLILEQAIADADMRSMLVTIFNDADEDNTHSLERALALLPGIERLRYQPQVYNQEVGSEIVKIFERVKLVPTLFFVDPWGYKGLSLRLVNSVLKDWGCDCIFFFNYNRINMGLPNEVVDEHMNALFGKERADRLRHRLAHLSPQERELTIVEEIAQALKEMGGNYVLPFTFRNDSGTRTSHHLIFVSKHFKGYEIMKHIMDKESSTHEQGVPSFEYSPADVRQPMLFALSRPLDDLGEMLLEQFAGRRVTMEQVYKEHSVGVRYVKRNYKEVLRALEGKGLIQGEPPASQRRANTFADAVLVTFPHRSKRDGD